MRRVVLITLWLLCWSSWGMTQPVWRTAQSVTGEVVTTLSLSHTGATQADRLATIEVFFNAVDGQTIPSPPTYGGVASTLVHTENITGWARVAMYQLINPSASPSQTVTVNFTTEVQEVVLGVKTFSNVHQITPLGTPVGANTAATGTASVTVTTAADELVNDIVGWCDAGTITVGANQTSRWNNQLLTGGGEAHYGAGSTQAGSDGGVMSWTNDLTGNCMAIVAVSIKPLAAVTGRRRKTIVW
jgi:hypothetical protein